MNTNFPEVTDIVILGGGLAGHCAALAAVNAGANVLLIEKASDFGGSSATGPGSFAFADTPLQRSLGIEDSPELLRQDLIEAGHGRSRGDLVDLYVDLQLETYDWLVSQGVPFDRVEASTYQTVPRSHPSNAGDIVKRMHSMFLAHENAVYVSECNARELKRDPTSGRMCAVIFEHGHHEQQVLVRRAVVLATGGFARSDRLVEKFAPEFINAVRMGGAANEGDGLLLAWAHGADLADTGYLSGTFGTSLNGYPDLSDRSGRDGYLMHPIFKGGIAVNLKARRFADESQSYKTTGAACLKQPKGVAFQVFDQSVMDQSIPTMMPRNFRGAYERGLVREASTISALAQTVNLDPSVLEQTVTRYNEFVDNGDDPEFGRRHLIGEIGDLVRLQSPPYYIYPCTTALLSTYGGLAVDTQMRVIDVAGKPIGGLYAAGEVTGGLHGASYLSGSSLAKSAIFGRVAGAAAAALPDLN